MPDTEWIRLLQTASHAVCTEDEKSLAEALEAILQDMEAQERAAKELAKRQNRAKSLKAVMLLKAYHGANTRNAIRNTNRAKCHGRSSRLQFRARDRPHP